MALTATSPPKKPATPEKSRLKLEVLRAMILRSWNIAENVRNTLRTTGIFHALDVIYRDKDQHFMAVGQR